MLAVESGPQMGRSVEKQVRWFWRFVMMPLMFGLVGASVNFNTIDKSIIPKAVAIVVAGQLLSAACSSAPQAFMHMNFKHMSYVLERISSDKAAYQVLLVTG